MCAITGFFQTPQAATKVREALNSMAERGKDAAGIYDGVITIANTPNELPYSGSEYAIGHILHSMVGCVPQPIAAEGILVANCEIYNWQELAEKYLPQAKNDTEVLLEILDQKTQIEEALKELDGVYAFAYLKENKLTLCRDLLGVKPLFYSSEKGFAFASERSALTKLGYKMVSELYPRTILTYNVETREITTQQREFFAIEPEHETTYEEQKEKVEKILREAVQKRIPSTPFGLLLSGGVDSSTLAVLLAKQKPLCYVVGDDNSMDVISAKMLAEQLNLQLTIISPTEEQLLGALPLIVNTVDDANPVKTSVGATFWFACAQAQKDGCKALFSGLGSEELFAGYERHRKSTAVNKECLAGLRKMHERDLYRDDVITMHHAIELRLPFLDRTLIEYALKIPAQYKITDSGDKWIFREVAQRIGVPAQNALRPKKAAQYGSGIMKKLERIAKPYPTVAAYLETIYGRTNKKLAALLSGGKDSILALHIMKAMNYEITCAITIQSKNKDSYMFHTPNTWICTLQAQSMGIPLLVNETEGEKELELQALREAIEMAKQAYGVEGIVVGAIQSQYQRERVEKIADENGLTTFCPLWQMNQIDELRTLLREEYEIIFTKVAAEGLDQTWLKEKLTNERIKQLEELSNKYGVHPAGEGGEYETLVLNAPLFKQKIEITDAQVIKDGQAATLVINKAHLK